MDLKIAPKKAHLAHKNLFFFFFKGLAEW